MSKTRKLKALRQEIRSRFNSIQKAQVIEEFNRVVKSNDKKLKRLYFTALDPILFDQANKET